ncbi:MAG: aminotransferase class V-fold PLP-dependent enzyme [Chloroflexi bacterium]|nr:aminotransferase class V-fold PLP-dependent enzyme [Chloroflexota bacterium]MDA1147223.1 aminotransferase class V-fold PLP-dependent enzyme [Chloroflexota bacterium]
MDLERVRADTPGVAEVAHFNNAGAALMPQPVIDAVIDHIQLEARIGGYEAAEQRSAALEHTYDAIATLLNCRREEVALLESATRAWDMAFYSMPFGPGDRILTATSEYIGNYIAYLEVTRKTGAEVVPVSDDEHGQLDVDALASMIDERTKLIAVTHVPTNGGLVNPAAAIGRVAREAGVPFLLDACQSVGQMPIDVQEIGCTMLSVTSRKFLRGPRGVGFLYIDLDFARQLEPILLDGRAANWIAPDRYELRPDARRFEEWESNIANRIGLGVAVDYALEVGLAPTYERIQTLASQLRAGLEGVSGVTLADQGAERCGIVTFYVDGVAPAEVKAALRAQRINVNTIQPGDTLLDSQRRGLPELVRSSVHYYNSEDEVTRLIEAVAELAPPSR